MTSTPKKSTEADDVLEFLNSLPENKNKNVSFKAKGNKGKDNEDVLDFLDELEKSDLKGKVKGKKDDIVKDETKKEEVKGKEAKEEEKKLASEEKSKESEIIKESDEQESHEPIQEFIDPISSISNWWSSSGSQAVTSIWSNAISISKSAQEEASKIANQAQQQLSEDSIRNRLSNLPIDDAKNLIEKAKTHKDPFALISGVLSSFNDDYDEIIEICLIHDLINFENLNGIIKDKFKKVLKQVQGDIYLSVKKENTKHFESDDSSKQLNLFEGKIIDGEKLAFANLQSSIQSIKSRTSSTVESPKLTDTETKDSKDETNISKLYISILPIKPITKSDTEPEQVDTIDLNSSSTFHFTIILKDQTHDITIISRTQAFPIKWAQWLEHVEPENKQDEAKTKEEEEEEEEDEDEDEDVDPAEWVKDWIDEGLALTIGVLAQDYVIKRMGY